MSAVIIGNTQAANILDGQHRFLTGSTFATILTIPAGRTWTGTLAIVIAASNEPVTAFGIVEAAFATAGAGVTPNAGAYLIGDVCLPSTVTGALSGVSGTTTVVTPFTIAAPAANAVTLTLTVTVTGANSQYAVDASAIGFLL